MFHIPNVAYPVAEYFLEDVLKVTRSVLSLNSLLSLHCAVCCHSYKPPPTTSKGPRKFYTHYGSGRSKFEQEQRNAEELESYIARLEAGRQYPSAVLEALRTMDMNEINLQLIMELVKYICRCMDPGAILIFLPGGWG